MATWKVEPTWKKSDIMDLVENPDEDGEGAFVCPECGGKVNLE